MAKPYVLNAGDRAALRGIKAMVIGTYWIKGTLKMLAGEKYRGKKLTKDCYCLVGLVNYKTSGNAHNGGYDPLSAGATYLREDRLRSFRVTRDEQLNANTRRVRILAALAMAIHELYPKTKSDCIELWNDRPQTRREDVVAVIDHALAMRRHP